MNEPLIHAYIPQRPPFVMIDELVSADDIDTITRFTVRENHLFVENGYFTEPGLIENMAQTAAASTGSKAYVAGEPAPVGFIGALKGLVITSLPQVGETIETKITLLHIIGNAHVAGGIIHLNGQEIARCEFKIFLQK